ncbi:MAG: hypothetical protein LBR15_07280 [Methanobrevibacter sp.]|jgi:hypothetical protein|nr:hypothetical protein [Candidatus Methanovirga australis]
MNIVKCLAVMLMSILFVSAVSATTVDLSSDSEVQAIYKQKNIDPKSVPMFDLKVHEYENYAWECNMDDSFKYEIYATEIDNEPISRKLIDSGSGDVGWKTLQISTLVTKIEFRFSGETYTRIWYAFIPGQSEQRAWWTCQHAVLQQSNYPNSSSHSVDFSSKVRGWPNGNTPFIKVDGNTGVFSNPKDNSWGYGWEWDYN